MPGRSAVPVLALCLTLGACSGASGEASPETPSAGVSSSAGASDLFYPFAGLTQVSEDQKKSIFEAKQTAIASCMKSRGFDYLPEPYVPADSTPNPWGDVDYARTHGYGLNFTGQPDQGSGSSGAPAPRNDVDHLLAATRAAWQKALDGSAGNPDAIGKDPDLVEMKSADGATYCSKSACRTYGDEQVQGDATQWTTAERRVQDLSNEVATAVDSDPRIAAKKREWATCMAKSGYQVTDPETAPNLIMDKARSHQITQTEGRRQEIAMATADAECVNSTGAPAVRRQVMADHEKAVLDAHQNDIMAFAELQKRAAAKAATLAGQ